MCRHTMRGKLPRIMTSTTTIAPDEVAASAGLGRFSAELNESPTEVPLELSERGHEVLSILNQLFERADSLPLATSVR